MRIIADVRSAKKEFSGRSARSDDGKLPDLVADVIAQVRETGDEALALLSRRFDGVELTGFEVPREQWAAGDGIDPDLQAAIGLAASRVEEFYRRQPVGVCDHATGSARLGQLVRPLERVGCYVPGGSAPLFSTLIMTAVPAKVAGVGEVVVATPPRKDGSVPPEILFAAKTVGVDRIYRLGGAQAIAALALGTESVPRVDKIVGPGNAYVVEAKRQLYGSVGIEALPGPTETLVIADGSADPVHVAADLLAQAEHLGAQPVLITTSRELLAAVLEEVENQLSGLKAALAARESLSERGIAVIVDSVEEALEVANAHAPEHLCLLVDEPERYLPLVQNAGGVFVGHQSMEAFGDYMAGPSHVMPTGGTARFASALNVTDFVKLIPFVEASAGLLGRLGPAAAGMARAEGLEAHARAIETRLEE